MTGRGWLAWLGVAGAMTVPVALAVASPYLAYRNPAYILGGFAGIVCLALLLIQPLLAAGYLPGLSPVQARRWHRRAGVGDRAVRGDPCRRPVRDQPARHDRRAVAGRADPVLGLRGGGDVEPLPGRRLVPLRRRTRLGPRGWSLLHNLLALVVVVATALHAVQIEGAMEPVSKTALCGLVLIATAAALIDVRLLRQRRSRWGETGSPSPVRQR